jgi:hypothetical protein
LDYIAEVENKTLFAGPLISKDLVTELGSHRIIEMPNPQLLKIMWLISHILWLV